MKDTPENDSLYQSLQEDVEVKRITSLKPERPSGVEINPNGSTRKRRKKKESPEHHSSSKRTLDNMSKTHQGGFGRNDRIIQ